MKLTSKDNEFLAILRELLEEQVLRVEMKEDGLKRLVLRQNYGSRVTRRFNLTRQGVRWRFNHLMTDIYIHAYETILWVESTFGTELRRHAMAIAKERAKLRKKAKKLAQITGPRRESTPEPTSATQSEK